MPRPTRWCRSNCKYKGKGKNNNISRILLFLQQFISTGLSFFCEPCPHVFNSFFPLASLVLQPILINSGLRLLDRLRIFVMIYWFVSFSVSSAFLNNCTSDERNVGKKDAYNGAPPPSVRKGHAAVLLKELLGSRKPELSTYAPFCGCNRLSPALTALWASLQYKTIHKWMNTFSSCRAEMFDSRLSCCGFCWMCACAESE